MAATLTTEPVTEVTVTDAGLVYITIYREGDVEVRCLTPQVKASARSIKVDTSDATDTKFEALRLSLMGEHS